MDSVLIWRWYDSIQVGLLLIPSTPTPVITTLPPVQDITFTVTYISNDDNILVSNLSFIADTASNGQTITCTRSLIREDDTIQAESGKDHQPYQRSSIIPFMFLIKFTCLLPTDSPPVVGVVSVANDTSTTTLAIEWTIANGVGGVLTVVVAPVATHSPLASGAGNTYFTTVTLLYNTNYSVEATATSCGGMDSSQISLLQGTATEVYSSKAQGVC